MIRLLHSADWQLGARFSQFGSAGARLREARLRTLHRTLELAQSHQADAFVIAGDLFEDNHVDDDLVQAVVALFAKFPRVPIVILPGNHDPFTGPNSVWQRRTFQSAPAHLRIVTEPSVIELGAEAVLLAAPLTQKLSTLDPSLKLAELAAALPAATPPRIRVGFTHGALAIEGKHQPNDFPIALHAASRAGLDYLGLGHWHNWLGDLDEGRILMPGTPEPDRFGHDASGRVALVEIDGPGLPPRIQPLSVASLAWTSLTFDTLAPEAARASLDQALAALRSQPERHVVRVTLRGTVSPASLASDRTWIEAALRPFLVGQIVDLTTIALSAIELRDLRSRHPLLAQVLTDLDQLELLATGRVPPPAGEGLPISTQSTIEASGAPPFTLGQAQALLARSKTDLGTLTAADFAHIRQLLLQTWQEVAP